MPQPVEHSLSQRSSLVLLPRCESVIVNYLDDDNGLAVLVGAELQNQSPLIIQPDRMLTRAVTFQLLESGTLEIANLRLAADRRQQTNLLAVSSDEVLPQVLEMEVRLGIDASQIIVHEDKPQPPLPPSPLR